MNHFQTILSDIFDRGAEHRLSQDEERETIHAAKAGDEAATVKLLYAYAATLRACATRYRIAGDRPVIWDGNSPSNLYERQEMQALAVTGLLEAVAAFDLNGPHDRLAATVEKYVIETLTSNMATTVPVSVPSRTLRRFFGILRRAEGDVQAAAAMAPSFEMSRETFFAVLRAVRTEYLDAPADGPELLSRATVARPVWDAEEQYADAEDRILVEMAFGAVDDLETDICRASYGFTSYNPIPDGQIAADLSMTRPTVQRRRAGALSKMRDALGA